MPRTRFVVAVVLTAVMVLGAGCAGFGTDGPADPSEVSNGDADDQENESPSNDTEATNESSSNSSDDSNEHDETDPPESSDEDDPDESPAVDGSDDGGSADGTEGTDSTGDAEESDDADSGTNSGQEDTASSDDGNGDTANDGNGDDAPAENGGDGDGGEDSPESGDENADGGDGGDADNESGEEEQVYTLTVEADSPVTLERTWEDASTTREPTDGTVEFSVIEGSYALSAGGYHDVPEEMAIQVDSDTTVTLQSEDGGEIEVNVVDAETGEPIEGAEISGVCDWYYSSGDAYVTGETDADGIATAHAELAPTDCDATVSAEGYESESVALSVPDDDGVTVELEPEVSETPETNTLTVEVTNAETGEPIEGAAVEAHGADGDPGDTRDLRYEAQTNENGVAEMEVQAAMNYVITVEAAGYETGHGEVSLDRETSIELTPEEGEEMNSHDSLSDR
ncbi:carboxypeptidase regulatory-like domain-containing protein [Halalkalicoccus ordinarius]|uniref:carboxypeptidase regulatory-like domain-containing protein n=1 Tax=Halalkalicoccus ordinarius TaxID=3116651 RepID=UPI00300F2FEE